MPTIFYGCDLCVEQYPEGSAYTDRQTLRVTPEGPWLCEGCYDDAHAHGTVPRWHTLPAPPEYVQKAPVEIST